MWAIYFKLIKKSRIISIIAQNSWLAFKTRYLTHCCLGTLRYYDKPRITGSTF